ncbi:hypothetical protein G6Z94_09325 [Vibrio aestuarianus]|uniref:hypothetical protein n=1 Tax=Vibrio aestuarianus TaxID=28171 RepID=UPI0015938993|nr:hypothetical protein [Vibrio aestuarianus]NGZ17544.1 hypothetical protein [Vibrio aestuarianus]
MGDWRRDAPFLIMLEKKNLWLTALAGAVAAFFVAKGDKLTQFFAGWATVLGAFSVNEWGVIAGIFLGFVSYFTGLYFKVANRKSLLKKLDNGGAMEVLLDEEET